MSPITLLKEMFTWRAALDIFVIAAVVFFLFRTLLRLGTWKIVAGILIAMAIFLAANLLDLTGIEWIYSNVSHVAAIALIVIFQPELRKIFERAASIKRTEIGEAGLEISTMVANAIMNLAQQRRGAIIVFPGKEPLREWLTGGYAINAEPSYPLILSIFDPNSPGHDGGLIIKNGILTRFGVRLPISKTTSLSEEYGTRHHAAMGLTEVSDALVLVVSEERGQISLFYQGKIQKVQNKDDICATIMNHWKNTGSYAIGIPKGKTRWYLFPQMIISLALAILVLAGIIMAQGERIEKVLTVPVEYTVTPTDLVLVGDKSKEVKLHLVGPKLDLGGLTPANLSVKIDLSKSMPGKQTFLITSDNIKIPKNVRLLDAEPSSLTLTLAAVVEQEIAIKPQLVGKVPKGLKLRSVELNPEKVRVLLPTEEGKNKIVSVTTTPIYLETIKEDTKLYCKIVAPPTAQPVEKRWPDVEVSILVGPK